MIKYTTTGDDGHLFVYEFTYKNNKIIKFVETNTFNQVIIYNVNYIDNENIEISYNRGGNRKSYLKLNSKGDLLSDSEENYYKYNDSNLKEWVQNGGDIVRFEFYDNDSFFLKC